MKQLGKSPAFRSNVHNLVLFKVVLALFGFYD